MGGGSNEVVDRFKRAKDRGVRPWAAVGGVRRDLKRGTSVTRQQCI